MMARVSRKAIATGAEQQPAMHVYRTAAYVRLSDEDIRKKLSDSIGTQKAMLTDFIQAHPDLQLYDIYEDVNYTGTNFHRPDFTRMIEDIQAGLVDCVLVKDLSRFGRSFEEMGHYLERVFPFLGVRFIAVSDGYDSLTATLDESSLIVPLKNLMNEVYARDISKKVQSSVKLKQKRGEFCGSIAPYGYIKDGPRFKVDDDAASVVRKIFDWILAGNSDAAIAGILNEQRILPPSRYRFEKGITKAKKHEDTRYWYKSAIKRISENPAYTGALAQAKVQSNFLHGGGQIVKDRDDWIVVGDTHPAIIDPDTFEAVRKIRVARKQNYKVSDIYTSSDNIFKGLIVCGDCKSHMRRERTRRTNGTGIIEHFFICNVFAEVNKNACTRKKIMESELQLVLFETIRREISIAVDMCRIIADLQSKATFRGNNDKLEKQIDTLQKRLQQNRRFRGSLREDYIDGVLNQQDYACMKADYDAENDELGQTLEVLVAEKLRQKNTLSPENKWIAEFRRFEMEQELSSQMVSALVERIEVFDGGRIDVKLRYRDAYQALQEYIDSTMWEARAANE